jgi:hypothetical protein
MLGHGLFGVVLAIFDMTREFDTNTTRNYRVRV